MMDWNQIWFDVWIGVRRNVLFIDGLESDGTLDGGVVNGV